MKKGLWAVAVSLSKPVEGGRTMTTLTMSYRGDSTKAEAVQAAIDYALKIKDGFAIDQYIATEIVLK